MTFDVLATGYPSLDYILRVSRTPKPGETAIVYDIPQDSDASYGGCGANVAVALRLLGFRPALAMVLGADEEAMLYRSHLRRLGIDDRDVRSLTGGRTSRSYLFLNPDGEYQNFFYAGAADAWDDALALDTLSESRYALLTVGALRYNRQFVELAWRAGIPLIWQLKPDIAAYPPDVMRAFASRSHAILMNALESHLLCEALGISGPAALVNDTTHIVVVTRGRDGAEVIAGSGWAHINAAQPAELVDPTGAGDAFTAGFVAGLLEGRDPYTCGRMGSTLASFALEKLGCQTNLPDRASLDKRMAEQFGVR